MITAIINLIGTLVICATVLVVTFMIIKTYLIVTGKGQITGLLNGIVNVLVAKIETITGIDIPGYGSENKNE